MENYDKIQTLILHLMENYRRRRTLLHHHLILSHNALIKNLSIKRRTNWNQLCALQNNTAAKFVIENRKYVRFRAVNKKGRCEVFFENLMKSGNEAEFFESFRMSKKTFELLRDKLAPLFNTEQPIFLTVPATIEKQLALCLYKLASGCSYNEVSKVFGVARSTAHKYFRATIKTILKFKKEFLNFPKGGEAISIAHNFKKVLKLPNILGVIGDTHIPILPPHNKQAVYMNIDGRPSLIMQAVVDHEYLFRDVYITHGSDCNVFKKSKLFQHFSEPQSTSLIAIDNDQELPLMLIGDSSYPLHSHLLKPYSESFSKDEKRFNSNLRTGLVVVKNAFKRLRARWQCLSREMELNPDFAPTVIMACAILHNFLEKEKEIFSDNWAQTLKKGYEFKEPTKIVSNEIILENSFSPIGLRESLKDYLN